MKGLSEVGLASPARPTALRTPSPPARTSGLNLLSSSPALLSSHDALHPGESLHLRETLAAHGVDADHVNGLADSRRAADSPPICAALGPAGAGAGWGGRLPCRDWTWGGEAGEELDGRGRARTFTVALCNVA